MPVNSKNKGARGELALVRLLQERFPGRSFSRSVGSGNRWAQVKSLPKHAAETYSGDICCPENFRWTIEIKNGYDDVDLGSLAGNKTLDNFLAQAAADAARASRKPLLAFKQNRRPWVAAIPATTFLRASQPHQHYLLYRGWWIFPLSELLKMDDGFWFSTT